MTARELTTHPEVASSGLSARPQRRAGWPGGSEGAPSADVAWQLIAEILPDARLTGCNGRPVPAVVDHAMYLIDGGMPLEHAASQLGLESEALHRMIELLEPALIRPRASPPERADRETGRKAREDRRGGAARTAQSDP